MRKLPARFTIERKNAGPDDLRRYLMVTDDGSFGWAGGYLDFCIFDSEVGARSFCQHRMGVHGSGAKVVRHTVH